MNLFFEHSADCSPLVPCAACEIVGWLRAKLSEEDFAALVERIHDLGEPKQKRIYKRRKALGPGTAEPDFLAEQAQAAEKGL